MCRQSVTEHFDVALVNDGRTRINPSGYWSGGRRVPIFEFVDSVVMQVVEKL
jgi:hypothetical protein